MASRLWEVIGTHLGKIYGTVFGLLLGWIIIRYGVLRGLFVGLCVLAGFLVGAHYDSKSGLPKVFERFLR
ncbi:MAG: DUF2273 domain-containing protein [Firmicutes bacterium]|nr:DUF2273 domain-containing protein [Bacillota bacterium]